MLERLQKVNDVKIYSVFDTDFAPYGKVLTDFDFAAAATYMEERTSIPDSGNVYIPGDPKLEALPVFTRLERTVYGEMPIQVGYCNGRNTTYNGFEYHKGSEVNIAVTDFMLVLGHTWQMRDNRFYVGGERVFYVPRGTAIEMYQTTLHLSPCRCCDQGFKDIVVLPTGTNTPLAHKPNGTHGENRLLLQKNKWVIAHKDRAPLINQGAFPGLIGENKELNY